MQRPGLRDRRFLATLRHWPMHIINKALCAALLLAAGLAHGQIATDGSVGARVSL